MIFNLPPSAKSYDFFKGFVYLFKVGVNSESSCSKNPDQPQGHEFQPRLGQNMFRFNI